MGRQSAKWFLLKGFGWNFLNFWLINAKKHCQLDADDSQSSPKSLESLRLIRAEGCWDMAGGLPMAADMEERRDRVARAAFDGMTDGKPDESDGRRAATLGRRCAGCAGWAAVLVWIGPEARRPADGNGWSEAAAASAVDGLDVLDMLEVLEVEVVDFWLLRAVVMALLAVVPRIVDDSVAELPPLDELLVVVVVAVVVVRVVALVVELEVDRPVVTEAVDWLPVTSSLSSSSLVQLPLCPWTPLLLSLCSLSLSLSLPSSLTLSLLLPLLSEELLLSESESDTSVLSSESEDVAGP